MPSQMIDFEALVETWAREIFQVTCTRDQAKIAKDHLRFGVDWRRVHFRHGDPEYAEQEGSPAPRTCVLFRTTFTNRTGQAQEYSLKADRVTRSTCAVEIERGVCTGYEMNVKLATPCEVFEANAGFKRELSLTSTNGESFEEELSWGVDSQIRVPPHYVTNAEMVITESGYASRFSVQSTCEGRVHVTVTNINDNNSFVKTIDGSIGEIVSRASKQKALACKVNGHVVSFETVGTCNFRFGVAQEIRLDQQELSD